MTPERFRQIVEAYGAVPQRWPIRERAAAEAFVGQNAQARDMLAREADLDRLLDAYRVTPPDSALTGAIIASIPSSRRSSWTYLLKGLGIMGAGLAGAIAGAFLTMTYTPSVPTLIDEDERPIFTSFDVNVSEFDLGETQ
ncbi:MAG: hypothetical protein H6R00_1736 [Proteobacteria bacterium]|nr:hypothetical protein [Pseudomonadota bacterium]